MKTRYKIISYVSAWLLAFFATDPTLGLWALAWMFPLGLFGFAYPPGRQGAGWAAFSVCVGLYVLHAILFFRSRQMRATISYFAILVLLLAANISGCRDMIQVH
jgi:hypothetical protein